MSVSDLSSDSETIRTELKKERSKKKRNGYDIYQIARLVQMLRCRGVQESISPREMRELYDALANERGLYQTLAHINIREQEPHTISIKRSSKRPHPGYMIPRLLLLIHFFTLWCTISLEEEDHRAIHEAVAMLHREKNTQGLLSLRETVELISTTTEFCNLKW